MIPQRILRRALSRVAGPWLPALLLLTACSSTPVDEAPPPLELPIRVLLLGDSISLGYTPVVHELLGERAEVQRAMKADGEKTENCAGTTHGVQHIDRWLAQSEEGWDVIHFNFGLHDLKRVQPENGKNSNDPDHPHQADPEQYRIQLSHIVGCLEATGARLVFATTTPVPLGVRPYRAPEDPVNYNRVALELMAERGIAINDLFTFAEERLSEIQNPADVHFTPEGSRALGEEVVSAILELAGHPSDGGSDTSERE